MSEDVLTEQARYYAARAGEYDDWWYRRGRYDRGPAATARWFAEAAEVEAALERFAPAGDVLELACGTGLWTVRLAAHADRLTALDASPEVLEAAEERLQRVGLGDGVELRRADLFAWDPEPDYDVVFFGFWLSHVPEERFDRFWDAVRRALRPGGRVFLVDSLRARDSTASDHVLPAVGDDTMVRRLDDGREFRIVKRFHEPDALARRVAGIGWRADLHATGEFFLYGSAAPGAAA